MPRYDDGSAPGFTHHCPGCSGYLHSWEECDGSNLKEVLMTYARRSLDGKPRHPDDQAVISRFAAWLAMTPVEQGRAVREDPEWRSFLGISRADLLQAGPVLSEQQPGYRAEWYCEPPEPGARFRAHPGGDEWGEENGQPVRRIFAIERIADAPPPAAGADRAGPAGPGPAAAPPGPPPQGPAGDRRAEEPERAAG